MSDATVKPKREHSRPLGSIPACRWPTTSWASLRRAEASPIARYFTRAALSSTIAARPTHALKRAVSPPRDSGTPMMPRGTRGADTTGRITALTLLLIHC